MYRLKQITLALGDLLMLYISLFLAIIIRQLAWSEFTFANLAVLMFPLFILAIVIIFITGLYDVEKNRNNKTNLSLATLSMIAWLILGLIYFYFNSARTASPKTILILNATIGLIFIFVWRWFYSKFISQTIWKSNVVFIGLNKELIELLDTLTKKPQLGYNIEGIVDENYTQTNESLVNYKIYKNLQQFLNENKTEILVLSPEVEQNQKLIKKIIDQIYKQIQIMPLASFYELTVGRIPIFALTDSWLISNLHEQNKKIYDRIKLIFDIFCAIIMTIFFIITFPIITLLIKINSHGPIFFKQIRVGRLGKTFALVKYRTMYSLSPDGSAEQNGPQFSGSNDQRITLIGKILRKTRLDEIPQFINIFKRDMSIIGPRPERPEFVKEMTNTTPYYALRHLIKPGLTGWAQIKHGYTSSMKENLRKLEYDLHYIKNRGPILDLVIVLRTINTIIRLSGK